MTNEIKNHVPKYDLEERTAIFGENSIRFCKKIPRNPITNPLITQYVKCSTSVGANYGEVDDAESREDFKHKIGIVKKECRESKHFIRIIAISIDEDEKLKDEARKLWTEAKELHLIFNAIYKKIKHKKSNESLEKTSLKH